MRSAAAPGAANAVPGWRPKVRIAGMVVLLSLATLSCSSNDPTGPDSSGLLGTWVGTAFFGIAGVPQPIQLTFDSNASTFGGTVITDNVPDGAMSSGTWNGTTATWTTTEGGATVTWQATPDGAALTGFVTGAELSFNCTRL